MNERITEAELARVDELGHVDIGNAMQSGCTDYACFCHFELPAIVDEVRRLRGLIAALDTAVEIASSGAIKAGGRLLYLREQVPEFFVEARAIREEQGKPLT